MRKAVAIAAVLLSLGGFALPASADDGESFDRDDFYREACEDMIWQFDRARTVRQQDNNFTRALALRDQAAGKCDYGAYDEGAILARTALQMIGVSPLH